MEKIKEPLAYYHQRCLSDKPRLKNIMAVHELSAALDNYLIQTRPEVERRRFHAPYGFDDIVGLSDLKQQAKELAAGRSDILLVGESGTGKEMFAAAIHNANPHPAGFFVPVNCNAIPATLFESEMFGFVRGSFTDARTDYPGKIVYAQRGTLFFDEIGDLALEVQGKLLRVLESHEVYPVGSNEPIKITARFIFATNRDLEQMTAQGAFRRDLYYRINPMTLTLPALRDRRQELPGLIEHLLVKIQRWPEGRPSAGPRIRGLTPEAMHRLQEYDFPGNVRELEGILRRACSHCRTDRIGLADLGLTVAPVQTLTEMVEEFRRRVIRAQIRHYRGDVRRAAASLKISTRSLYRYLKKDKIIEEGEEK